MIVKPNRRQFLLSAAVLGTALLAGACETPVQTQRLPEITFAHLPVFRVDVAKVEVVNRFTAPLKAPHVEHQLPTAPATALTQWAKDRLQAVGSAGTLRFTIENASATETGLGRDESLKGKFTKQQAQRYDVAARATLTLSDGAGRERGTATAAASHAITVREDISLNDRERTQFDLVDKLLADFNTEMSASIHQHLGSWLR